MYEMHEPGNLSFNFWCPLFHPQVIGLCVPLPFYRDSHVLSIAPEHQAEVLHCLGGHPLPRSGSCTSSGEQYCHSYHHFFTFPLSIYEMMHIFHPMHMFLCFPFTYSHASYHSLISCFSFTNHIFIIHKSHIHK